MQKPVKGLKQLCCFERRKCEQETEVILNATKSSVEYLKAKETIKGIKKI